MLATYSHIDYIGFDLNFNEEKTHAELSFGNASVEVKVNYFYEDDFNTFELYSYEFLYKNESLFMNKTITISQDIMFDILKMTQEDINRKIDLFESMLKDTEVTDDETILWYKQIFSMVHAAYLMSIKESDDYWMIKDDSMEEKFLLDWINHHDVEEIKKLIALMD